MQNKNPMKYAVLLSVFVTQLAVSAALAASLGDDPIIALPEVLIIVDSSGSMLFGAYGDPTTCEAKKPLCWNQTKECVGKGKVCQAWGATTACAGQTYCCKTWSTTATTCRTRQELIREVLTGEYNASYIGQCQSQATDGILDLYKDQIRFGFAQFDNNTKSTWDYPTGTAGNNCGHEGIRNRLNVNLTTSGPLIDLINPTKPDDVLGHNVDIQSAACNSVAALGTPLSPALWDADYYFDHWRNEVVPIYVDPYVNCRQRYVILLTDGQEDSPSYCTPPATRAATLWTKGVTTFVVGFGDDPTLTPNLNAIARAGSGGELDAFMANDKDALTAHFKVIMDGILASTNSRTAPASAPSMTTTGTSYRYLSYFNVSGDGTGWTGHVVREKMTLDTDGNPIYTDQIDFADVLATQSYSTRRVFTASVDPRSAEYTPSTTNPDRYLLPRALGTENISRIQDAFDTDINPLMCVSDDTVADTIKNYVLGYRSSTDNYPRLGDVFHSNPVVVPPPSPIAPDYRFGSYYLQNKDRYTMLYVGANDGMLHAFVAEDTTGVKEPGTELWGFIPTNLLAKLGNMMKGHAFYVDSTPVVRDVLFQRLPLTDENGNVVTENGLPVMGAYRTVLVAGERAGGSAYFALDITDPENPKYLWEYRTDVVPGSTVASNYTSATNQCGQHRLETWAEPIIGDVWLKNGDNGDPAYITKTVMVVPGGYFPPTLFENLTSCIDVIETLVGAASIHIIDIETGQLLRKFLFTTDATDTLFAADLEKFYNDLETNPTGNWNHWAAGKEFKYGDLASGNGWVCGEMRASIQNRPYVPPALLDPAYCTVTENTGTITYQKACCYNPSTPSCNETGAYSCSYRYTKYKNGRTEYWIKTEGCSLVPNDMQGRYQFTIGNSFSVESVNAFPAAYDTTMGAYLSRIYVPTSRGKVWQVNIANGKYVNDANEGSRVVSYTAGTTTYDWSKSLWFDTVPHTNNIARPIMVSPTLALDYQRNLVLFLGTGVTDSLEYTATQDYFFAVKETKELDTEGFYVPKGTGEFFCNTSSCTGKNPLALATAERLFGKPLVVNGKVFFSTYRPDSDACSTGTGLLYGLQFDDFTQGILENGARTMTLGNKTPSPPTVIWGPKTLVQVQTQTGTKDVAKDEFNMAARIFHWAKVL